MHSVNLESLWQYRWADSSHTRVPVSRDGKWLLYSHLSDITDVYVSLHHCMRLKYFLDCLTFAPAAPAAPSFPASPGFPWKTQEFLRNIGSQQLKTDYVQWEDGLKLNSTSRALYCVFGCACAHALISNPVHISKEHGCILITVKNLTGWFITAALHCIISLYLLLCVK